MRRNPTATPCAEHARLLAPLALAAVLAAGGCTRRSIEVTSEPTGALVTINGREVGRTPLVADFTWDGVYDVRLERDGYQPIATSASTDAPWWDLPGPDLIAEVVPPRRQRRAAWNFTLEPIEVSNAGIMERAEAARASMQTTALPEPAAESVVGDENDDSGESGSPRGR